MYKINTSARTKSIEGLLIYSSPLRPNSGFFPKGDKKNKWFILKVDINSQRRYLKCIKKDGMDNPRLSVGELCCIATGAARARGRGLTTAELASLTPNEFRLCLSCSLMVLGNNAGQNRQINISFN